MEKNYPSEIVFGSSNPAVSKAISRAVKAKKLRKIAPRVYTSNFTDQPKAIIARNLYAILGELFPQAVISHRSALEGKPTDRGEIFLTYKYTKKVSLPGLHIQLIQGPGPLKGDTAFMGKLYLASRPRAFLENLQQSRRRNGMGKNLTLTEIEERLENLCRIYGPEELNRLRDAAKPLVRSLKLTKEFKILNDLIGAILGTHAAQVLKTSQGKARAVGEPYDTYRIELFMHLAAALQIHPLPRRGSTITSNEKLQNFAFFEAYFSNYIEGTEFLVEEASDIIFQNKINVNRPEDTHDILGTYHIIFDRNEMCRVPTTAVALIELLKKRHAILLGGRPNKNPGQFKEQNNRAGNTVFVDPTLVIGTLKKGFEIYKNIELGLPRAIFIMFLIAEVHPFMDGNGRIARIMMNAELDVAKECRIIIPTVYREDYLLTLRKLSREQEPKYYIRMLDRAQQFSASIDFSDYEKALVTLRKCNAFLEPDEGMLKIL